MKRHSEKREAKQRSYIKMLRNKPCDGICEGCGKRVPLTPSHIVPRSYDIDWLDREDNVHWHCHACHRLCEAGRYEEMKDGKRIVQFLKDNRPDYLAIKELKHGGEYFDDNPTDSL